MQRSGAIIIPAWLCLILTPFCIYVASTTTKRELEIVFIWIALVPLAWVVAAYIFFMFSKPEYLRSETFQAQKLAFEMLGEKGKLLGTTAGDVVSVANPASIPGKDSSSRPETRKGGP